MEPLPETGGAVTLGFGEAAGGGAILVTGFGAKFLELIERGDETWTGEAMGLGRVAV